MKKTKVDAKGLACPQPVILTKRAIAQMTEGEIVVCVDNDVAKENVMRMAKHEGCSVSANKKKEGIYEVQISKGNSAVTTKTSSPKSKKAEKKIAYLFDSDFIGTNRDLGKVLSNGFLNAISALPDKVGAIVLISNGVKLATKGSYVLETLANLMDSGFEVLICGTCLDYLKIRQKVKLGTVSNALEIMESLTNADKVIKF